MIYKETDNSGYFCYWISPAILEYVEKSSEIYDIPTHTILDQAVMIHQLFKAGKIGIKESLKSKSYKNNEEWDETLP
jgi:DNA-directed RNA polymerase sigma subunit (sigma70/sigma32)